MLANYLASSPVVPLPSPVAGRKKQLWNSDIRQRADESPQVSSLNHTMDRLPTVSSYQSIEKMKDKLYKTVRQILVSLDLNYN